MVGSAFRSADFWRRVVGGLLRWLDYRLDTCDFHTALRAFVAQKPSVIPLPLFVCTRPAFGTL